MSKHLLDYEQMAEELGVSHWTLRRLVKARKIPVIKLTPQLLKFDPEKVKLALEKLTVKAI